MRLSKHVRFASGIAAAALLATACSSDEVASPEETVAPSTGETTAPAATGLETIDLSGLELAVGSKDFTEQLILGEIYAQALAAAGATVENKVNLGGTVVAREALLAGEIDVYPEYNGTGWVVHLGREDPSFDPTTLTEGVRAADREENGIVWVSQAPFNDTYGFAVGPDFVAANGELNLQGMADYLAANEDASVCLESEFPSRDDGLVLFENATGFDIPESQIQILDTGIIYNETALGNCTFGEIYTTDGRIPALELDVIDDPGVFILYNISANVREDKYEPFAAQLEELFDAVHAPLSLDRMAELNALVSVEGAEPADVARDYLVEEGLISA
jgi:osmoprotectant transport system substrate-binding protein